MAAADSPWPNLSGLQFSGANVSLVTSVGSSDARPAGRLACPYGHTGPPHQNLRNEPTMSFRINKAISKKAKNEPK